MHLEPLGGGDDDGEFRMESALAAFDVKELLCSEVSTETCFCHHIVGEGHCHACGNDCVATVGNVGEGTSMHKGWSLFGGLDEVGFDGIHQ